MEVYVTSLLSSNGGHTLDGVAQWTEHHPVVQKVASLTPHQGICLGSGPGPQLGVCER